MWMFLTVTTATMIEAFLSGGVCAVSLYTGKSAVHKKVLKSDKNSKSWWFEENTRHKDSLISWIFGETYSFRIFWYLQFQQHWTLWSHFFHRRWSRFWFAQRNGTFFSPNRKAIWIHWCDSRELLQRIDSSWQRKVHKSHRS